MISFDLTDVGLDNLFMKLVDSKKYLELFAAVSKLLLLARGTANIESDFSFNKMTIEDNQNLESLIALQRCKDGLKHCGGVSKFEVSKSVLTAVTGSRTRYERDLKCKQSDGKFAEKRKLNEDINVADAKIERLTDEVKHLISVADTKEK